MFNLLHTNTQMECKSAALQKRAYKYHQKSKLSRSFHQTTSESDWYAEVKCP